MAKSKSKTNNKIKISFIDEPASEDVTGSMVYIQTKKHNILIDAGLHQTNDRFDDFIINNRRFKEFKPKDIDLIFATHCHIDHIGLIPRLFKEGCNAGIIMCKKNKEIYKTMVEDCAKINESDVVIINSQKNKNYKPLYTNSDVYKSYENLIEFTPNDIHVIDEELRFQLIPSGHLLGSCQIKLFVKNNNVEKTILVTGDIGNRIVNNKYVGKFEKVEYADIVIGESTYGDKPNLKISNKERKTDLNKIKSIIDTQLKELHGRVAIPSFAQCRTIQLIDILYELYGDDDSFTYDIKVDSPLALKLIKQYSEILDDDEKDRLNNILQWKNLKLIKETSESKASVSDRSPSVIISTSGFCQVGRIRHYIKSIISDPQSSLLFVGYSSPTSLAGLLKDPKRKSVNIDGKDYTIKCSSNNLKSFSGHAPFKQLIDYYSSINCQKIILHHGSKEAKMILKSTLDKEYEKKCKTTRVSISNSSMKITL